MNCSNDTCKSYKDGNCKFPKKELTLSKTGICVSYEPVSITCGTCGSAYKKGYKLFCNGWGDPHPSETYPDKPGDGCWTRRI